jgi:hypothetical protein
MERGSVMSGTLRLIDNPVDRLARTIEALLVIAPAALSVEELATATEDEAERVETALGLLASRYREGRSGIVLEQVAGGYAFRAAREAAEACARLVERPVQRGLSRRSRSSPTSARSRARRSPGSAGWRPTPRLPASWSEV